MSNCQIQIHFMSHSITVQKATLIHLQLSFLTLRAVYCSLLLEVILKN